MSFHLESDAVHANWINDSLLTINSIKTRNNVYYFFICR